MISINDKLVGLEPKWKLTWDYLGWKKHTNYDTPITQNDWNQTLVTKINEISAQIHMSTLIGPADIVVSNSDCAELIKQFEYFNPETNMIGTRFQFIVDDNIKENVVYVYCTKDINNCPEEKLSHLIGKIELEHL